MPVLLIEAAFLVERLAALGGRERKHVLVRDLALVVQEPEVAAHERRQAGQVRHGCRSVSAFS